MIPEMLGTIIELGVSPWAVNTTWISKKETLVDAVGRWPLRMVHTYCPLNNVTMKTEYPIKQIEPILDDLSRPGRRYFFSKDAVYRFYAVPIHPPHAYKTAFNSISGQFYYTRMPMGLTITPATYARLKDMTFGPIAALNPEPSVTAAIMEAREGEKARKVGFRYFFDDDYEAADTFEDMLWFLNNWYFPRIKWAKLTLKPSKSAFFMSKIDPLGLTIDTQGQKASKKKQDKISQYPTPQSEKDIDNFLHLTIYLKALIPGRTEHARILKDAVVREGQLMNEVVDENGADRAFTGIATTREDKATKRKKKGTIIGFHWGQAQQDSFKHIKNSFLENIITGGDPNRQYYLSVCAKKHGFGRVLFQLKEGEEFLKSFPKGRERVVQFISQSFSDTESRYLDVERECLAILQSLKEVRFLILNSKCPIVIYSDAAALINLLGKDDSKGRTAGWRVRISEYTIDPRVGKIRHMVITNGLSRMPYDLMDEAWTRDREWEDVYGVSIPKRDEEGRCHYILGVTDRLTITPKGETVLNNHALVVYCDGACRKYDGKARSSIGVYFGPGHAHNLGNYVSSSLLQTNQVAELVALRRAIEEAVNLTKHQGCFDSVVVATDAEYIYKGLTEWIYK